MTKVDIIRGKLYYKLTRTGRKQLEGEVAPYARLTETIAKAPQTA